MASRQTGLVNRATGAEGLKKDEGAVRMGRRIYKPGISRCTWRSGAARAGARAQT